MIRILIFVGPNLLLSVTALAQEKAFKETRRYKAPEATQAVGVDDAHFYAIANSIIAKYDKASGKQVDLWRASKEVPLRHLNSGLVRDGKLYCANSNFPQYPEASSVEIWDTKTMKHVDTHSFGIYEGSLTWIDWHDGSWWAVFAHYSKKVNDNKLAKSHRYTSLVRFDEKWRRTGGWVFPKKVLERFDPHSCSGGLWGADNAIWCTGHDLGEVYRLEIPKAGPTLILTNTVKAPITGQGIAWDPDGKTLFGISRRTREVVASKMEE